MRKSALRTLLVWSMLCSFTVFAQRGIHGARTVTAANTIVNEYTAVTANIAVGATTISVAASSLNANARFPGNLAPGDLIMIYQVQGATINGTLTGTIASPLDSSWGRILNYNTCGNWEFAEVRSVPNATSITLDCGTRFDYTNGGTNHAQVIRVPRWTTLTVNAGGVLTCDDWNGTIGGVLAVEVDQNTVINGSIDATGRGFRGGTLVGDNLAGFANNMGSTDPNYGARKGEGIAGNDADYDPMGGRYGRGAAANAGGGGCGHNGGGGGGANAGLPGNWKGMGVADPNVAYTAAWNLDPMYGLNYITTLSTANSSGGGRGGYSWGSNNSNATTTGPNNAAWGGANRAWDQTGLGGRPLNYATGRLFFGGAGGAGDQNNNFGGIGGDGGGLIYIMNYGTITGTGSVTSNGNAGANAQGTPPNSGYSGSDGAGGGGAGGAIVLNSVGAISGITANANGGAGGNQVMVAGPFFFGTINESQGPGGGGGGGYIARSNGVFTQNANGGNNGTTTSPALSEFPPNGAMRGGTGTTGATVTNFTWAATNISICAGQTATLTGTITGTPPPGAGYVWWDAQTGGNVVSNLNPFITPVLFATTTYYLEICPGGTYRVPVTVTVTPQPAAPTLGSNSPICAGQTINLTSNTVVGATYTWTGPNSFSSALEDPSITNATVAASGTYSLTISVNGCTSPQSTIAVTVNPGPTAPTAGSNSPICSGQTLNLTSNTVVGATYTWTGPNSFSSALEDPSITNATTAATGTYSVTVTVGGCTSTFGTVAVVVNPTPAAPTPASNTPVCAGQTLNLTSNTIVGATYTWTGPNSFSSALEDPSILNATVAASGTYSLTVTVGGCTSTQATTVVTVNPPPATPTAGSNSPICSGQNLNLTANTVVGATYTWTGPNSFSSSLEDPTILNATTAASGTYSVTVSVGGCVSTAGTVNVVVNPVPATPTAGSNSPICEGQTLNLTSNTVVGAVYTWNGPNSFSSALEDPSIVNATTAASGTYSVQITLNGCVSSAGTVTVVVNPIPAAPTAGSNSPVCEGQTLNLTSNTVGGATYTWTGPNSFSSALEDPGITNVTLAAAGTYSVTVSVNGCVSTAGTTVVTINPTPAAPTAGSNSPICAGQQLNLTSNTVGGAIYSWTGPNSFVSALEDPSISNATPAESGTYSVTVTVNGCSSANGTVNVVVNALPTASAGANQTLCNGDSVQLNGSGGTGYSWSPSGTLSSGSISNPFAFPVTNTTYTLTVTDANGCSATDSVDVAVNALPTVSAGNDQSMCFTGSVTLNASGATNYVWSPNVNLSCTNCASPTATPPSTQTYIVQGTDANGCADTDTITVNVSNNLVVTAGNDQTICVGGTAALVTSGGGTYAWSPAGSLDNSASATPNATPTVTTTYSVIVTDVNGCQGTDSVTVFVNPAVIATTAGGTTICIGQSASISASATGGDNTYSYNWLPGPLTGSPVSVSPVTNTTYTVTVTDGNGCSATQTVTVTVNPPLTVTATQSAVTICSGGSANIGATGSGGDGTYSYSWSPATGLSSSTAQNPSANPVTTTTYTVTVSDNCGTPTATTTVTVNVSAGPTVTAAASATTGCAPFCVNFNGQSNATCITFTWDFGDSNTNTTNSSPTYCYTTPGTFTAQYTCNDANGCTGTGTVSITVTAPPVAAFTSNAPGGVIIAPPGSSTQICFTDQSTGATSWNWLFDNTTSNTQSPCFTVNDTGSFCALLVVTDAAGCFDSIYNCVDVVGQAVFTIPNVFTPNSDGINDMFVITNSGVKELRCVIFDRWGVKVYEWNSLNGGWDGHTTSGQMASDGVYYYVAYITDYTDTQTQQEGFLQLIQKK